MKENTLDINRAIVATDTKEVTDLLESLDDNSKALAKTYLSALADRQRIERIKLETVSV